MPDRTPAEILVARLSGVDDPAERVRIAAEALDEVRAEERAARSRLAGRCEEDAVAWANVDHAGPMRSSDIGFVIRRQLRRLAGGRG